MKDNHQNFVSLRKVLRPLLIMSFLFGASGCAALSATGGNGALPQAVIPNELVTVSSSDEVGYVSVTGAPNSAASTSTVIVTASGARVSEEISAMPSSSYLALNSATSCPNTVIPACPELSSINKCQVISNEDGSFTADVPSILSDLVTVDYLDPNTCQAKNVLQNETVPDNVPPLGIEAFSVREFEGYYYVYGTVSGVHTVLKVDPSGTYTVNTLGIENVEILAGQVPQHIDVIRDNLNPRSFFVLTTITDTYVGILLDGETQIEQIKPMSNASNPGERWFFYQDFVKVYAGDCDTPENPHGDGKLSLIFTNQAGEILILNDLVGQYDSGTESLNLENKMVAVQAGEEKPRIAKILRIGSKLGFFVSYMNEDDSLMQDYFVGSLSKARVMCQASVAFPLRSILKSIGTASETRGYNVFFDFSHYSLTDGSHLATFTLVDKELKLIKLLTIDPDQTDDFTLLELSEADFPTGNVFGHSFLGIPYLLDDKINFLVVNNLGIDFIHFSFLDDYSGINVAENIDAERNIIDPSDIKYDRTVNKIITLDKGNPDDDRSNLNFFDPANP